MSDLVLNDVVFPYDPKVITQPIEDAIRSGSFESEEAAELAHIVEPGDSVLEIGAGTGFISTLLSRFDKVNSVLAVEANPALLPYMAQLHAANDVINVRRLNAVLSNGGGTSLPFYQRCDFWMGSLSAEPNAYLSVVDVPVQSLDRIIAENQISMIVCDIEGAETQIFAQANLGAVTRIYVELHDHITGLKGVHSLFGEMTAQGFTLDPRHSAGSVVLFRKVDENEILRPYAGT